MEIINISESVVNIIEIRQFNLDRILQNNTAIFHGDSLFHDLQESACMLSPSMKPFLEASFENFEICQYHTYLKEIGLRGIIRKIAVPFIGSQEVINDHLTMNPEHLYVTATKNMFFEGLIYGETEGELENRAREWGDIVEKIFSKIKESLCIMDDFKKEKFFNNKVFRLKKIMSHTEP